jgi:glutamate-1-semialdehyde aminotransferase
MTTRQAQDAPKLNLTKSMAMLEDAQRLTPGGVGGIRRPYNFVVGEYPVFITHGQAGHIFDVDGNEYIDMLCAYGPIILGYVEDEINDAAKAQMDKGFCFSLVQPLQNELEQRLADLMPCGEQTILVKTGSDATNAAVRAMRAYTGRDVVARCGYHGWGDWCVEQHGGVPAAVTALTKEFEYGDIADLERIFAENPGAVAGVIITPVGHPMAKPIIAPPDGYLQAVVDLCHKNGAVVTFDEIRTGFRVSMGGASERYGVVPDLTTVGKAMANGYSIAALVGKREVMSVYVKDAFLSSTYFPNSLEMAASMKCLEILEREKVQDAIWERGTRFLERLGALVDASGVPVTKSGIPPMPFLTFDHVDAHYKERRTEFYTQCIRRGLFVQPYHHWYLCYRHTEADLDRALEVVEESLAYVAASHPWER